MKVCIPALLGLQVFNSVRSQDNVQQINKKELNVPCSKEINVKQLTPSYRLEVTRFQRQ